MPEPLLRKVIEYHTVVVHPSISHPDLFYVRIVTPDFQLWQSDLDRDMLFIKPVTALNFGVSEVVSWRASGYSWDPYG